MTLCNNNARIPYSQTDNVQIWRAPRQVFCFIVAYPCKIALLVDFQGKTNSDRAHYEFTKSSQLDHLVRKHITDPQVFLHKSLSFDV